MAYRQDPDLDFLGQCSSEELADLVYLLTFDKDNKARLTEQLSSNGKYKRHYPDHKMYWEEIAEEVQRFGGNTISNFARLGKGVLYREILCDVCDKVKAKYDKESETIKIEQDLMLNLLEASLDKMSPEELKAVQKMLGIGNQVALTSKATVAALSALLVANPASSVLLYITIGELLVTPFLGTAAIGSTASFLAARAVAAAVPITLVVSSLWAIKDISGTAYRVTIPAVIQIALLRMKKNQETMTELEMEDDVGFDLSTPVGRKIFGGLFGMSYESKDKNNDSERVNLDDVTFPLTAEGARTYFSPISNSIERLRKLYVDDMYNRDTDFYEKWKVVVRGLESSVKEIENLLQFEKDREEQEATRRIEQSKMTKQASNFLKDAEEWS